MKKRVDDFLHFLAIEKGYSRHTIAAYQNDLEQFRSYLQVEQIASWRDVRRNHILDYIRYLRSREYASSTVARKVASIKSFFNFLVTDGLLDVADDPTTAVDLPSVDESLPNPLKPEEMARLLAEPAKSNSPRAVRDLALFELMYATGMRASEVLGLKLEAIDLEEQMVRCTGKGDKERILPLYDRACAVLADYVENARQSLIRRPSEQTVFLNHHGRPLSRQGLWLLVKDYAEAAGIERRVTPHTFRHTFATHMLNGGAGLREVQELLGHANIVSTQIYTKVSDRLKRKAYDKAHPRA